MTATFLAPNSLNAASAPVGPCTESMVQTRKMLFRPCSVSEGLVVAGETMAILAEL